MSSFIKKCLFIVAVIVVLWGGIWFAIIWHRFIYLPIKPHDATVSMILPPGKGIAYVSRTLQQQALLRYPQLFMWMARVDGYPHTLKAGEYAMKPGMTIWDLLSNMRRGNVLMRHVTLIEGSTFRDIKQVLDQNSYLQHQIAPLSNTDIMQKLGAMTVSPEGQFFPDTYFFTWGDSDFSILQQAYHRMQHIIQAEWLTRDNTVAYQSSYEALIVASLIEREAALPDERPKIAGVIMRRLQKNMRLQIDPTVSYGLSLPYGAALTKAELNTNTPYNTYRHGGLPPTPIAMPSRASIHAALHPAVGDTLYYVARGNGAHFFSVTYQEHREAIVRFLIHPTALYADLPEILFLLEKFSMPAACFIHVPLLLPSTCVMTAHALPEKHL